MMHTEASPINPRVYLRQRIDNVRLEVEALRADPRASRWLAQGQQELHILEAELAAVEKRRREE